MAGELPFPGAHRNEPSTMFGAGKFGRKRKGLFMLLVMAVLCVLWFNSDISGKNSSLSNIDDYPPPLSTTDIMSNDGLNMGDTEEDILSTGDYDEELQSEILSETNPDSHTITDIIDNNDTSTELKSVIEDTPIIKNYMPGHFRYLVVVASNSNNRDRRQLIRENYFGLVDNLQPCMKVEKNMNYLFYIYGDLPKSKTAERRLYETEKMEWNDLYRDDNSQSFNQDNILRWVSTTLSDRGISFDHLIIQDDYTFIQINYIQQIIQKESSELPLDRKSTEIIWKSSNSKAEDVLIIGSDALNSAFEQEEALNDYPSADSLLTKLHDYYTSIQVQLKFITAKEGRTRLTKLARTLPIFIQGKEDKFLKWNNHIESIPPMSVAVSHVYQSNDFNVLSRHLNLAPTSLCKHIDKPTIAVLTSSFIYEDSCMEPSASYAADNKRDYALAHGYSFVARSTEFAQQSLYEEKRRTVWGKIDAVEKVLPKYDWIFWMDMDAVIMNPDISVHTILDELRNQYPDGPQAFEANIDLVIAKPMHDKMINAGVFFLRNTKWSLDFLQQVQHTTGWFNKGPSYEQGAMWDLIQYGENKRHVMLLDNDDHTFNTFPKKYQPGDFIVHFAPDKCPNPAVLKGLKASQLLKQGGIIDSLDEA